ncbi:MAG: AMP-binding protein, partial [bacterium]|nr:AMP-binding protein [bacterium]
MFEERVEKTPGNIALKYQDDTLSYREVNERANQLARVLRNKGIGPDNLVGIMVERSFEMMVGIFAIIKAGGAYLPIDPNYPEDRVRYLFKDSDSRLLLTQEKHIEFAGTVQFDGEVLNLEAPTMYEGEKNNVENVNRPADMAYIIYTSGSTGKPKGVLVEHGNVARLVKNTNFIAAAPGNRLLLTGNIVFDITTFEIWYPLLNGLTLFLADQEVILDAERLGRYIIKNKISILHLIPQLLNQLA